MSNLENAHRSFLGFLLKFLFLFAFLNYGTFYFIGLATQGGYYVEFIDRYFDYPEGLLKSLLWGCRSLYMLFGISTEVRNYDQLWIKGGAGVQIAYDCLGYGVLSFWIAYVLTNLGKFKRKIVWIFGGSLLLWFINVMRISLFLRSVDRKWDMPFGIDHHTWFNIASYACIFLMIFTYEKTIGNSKEKPAISSLSETKDNDSI